MPSKEKERVYWDSCVFIDLLQRSPARIDVLDDYIQLAEKNELEIVTSDFTLCEVATLKELGLPEDEVERLIVDFFENPYILMRSLDRRVAAKAREIMRAVPGVKGKDAVHLASAALSAVTSFHTYDHPLLTKAPTLVASGKMLDKDGAPLRVEQPPDVSPPMISALRNTNIDPPDSTE
jgi:predicted nucleic acid-binding protein